jgi:SAM-dependent methyltransferase
MKLTRKKLDGFLATYATDARILDIGAGGSSYDRYFPNRVTIDIDPGRMPDIVGDAHALPFKDGEFSTVLCTEVFEHVRDPRQVASEMSRVLAPGGTLILTTRFVYPLHDTPHDHWRFTKYALRDIFAEWDIVTLEPEAGTFSTIGVLLQRIGFQTRLRGGKVTKACIYALAWVFDHLNWLVVKEYGDIKRSVTETDILASGYYLVCKKPS